MGFNFKERVVIAKQKKEDGGGTSVRCSKHGIPMQIVRMGPTHAQLACPKCNPEQFK